MTTTPNRVRIPVERFYENDPAAPPPNVPLSPGVSAVIFDSEDRILFLKRTSSEYWSLPGGRMDMDESAQDCCVRETEEETGLKTRIVRLISVNTNPRSIVHYPDGNVHRSFVLCFEASVVGGELRAGPESERFRWCSPSEVDALPAIPDSRNNARDAWARRPEAFIR